MDRPRLTPTRADQGSPDDPTTLKGSSETGGSWIGSISSDLVARRTSLESASESWMRERVGQDPLKWLKSSTKRLLRVVPEGIPAAALVAETEAFWLSADARLAQCAQCPSHGGACAGSHSAVPDGNTIVRAPEGGNVLVEPCPRWALYKRRMSLSRTGVPNQLLATDLASMLATATHSVRTAVTRYITELQASEDHRWLVLTGGSVMQRTKLLVAVLGAVLDQHQQRCLYDWSPQLFKNMLSHINNQGPNPLEPINDAWFLALDFVDATRWKQWFVDEIDNLFFSRWGKPLAIGTPRTVDQLSKDFEQSGGCFEGAIVVDVSGVGR